MPEHADFLIGIFYEIEAVNAPCTQLQKVIVETFLANADHGSSILKRVPHQLFFALWMVRVWHDYAIVETPPDADFLDYFLDRTLFGTLNFPV